ncbi:hypothetical protein NQD34_017500 [Periophthalmus magnuspinnatus]|nr:hypothetical protein NQD34_017500 [Periophthalmus magnuspinnatus]
MTQGPAGRGWSVMSIMPRPIREQSSLPVLEVGPGLNRHVDAKHCNQRSEISPEPDLNLNWSRPKPEPHQNHTRTKPNQDHTRMMPGANQDQTRTTSGPNQY